MKLYHGTTEPAARAALAAGLQPRSAGVSASNWEHGSPSSPDAVYLTDTYPLYFAIQAGNIEESPSRLAVIEVDTELLDAGLLVPDEDVLEQMGRRDDSVAGDTLTRQAWYRDRLSMFAGKHEASLRAGGTCAYLGVVPPAAITRVAYVDYRQRYAAALCHSAMDASISLLNFRLIGSWHRYVTARLFGERPELSEMDRLCNAGLVTFLDTQATDGVEVVENCGLSATIPPR